MEVTFTQLSQKCRESCALHCSYSLIFNMPVQEQAPTVHLQMEICRCLEEQTLIFHLWMGIHRCLEEQTSTTHLQMGLYQFLEEQVSAVHLQMGMFRCLKELRCVEEQTPIVHLQMGMYRCIKASRYGGQRVKEDIYQSFNSSALNRFWLAFNLLNRSDWKNMIMIFLCPWGSKLNVQILHEVLVGIVWTFIQLLCTCCNILNMQELQSTTLHMNHKLFCYFTICCIISVLYCKQQRLKTETEASKCPNTLWTLFIHF